MMRQKLVFMTAMAAVLLNALAVNAESIQWAANLDEARTMAVQQNKLLLIHFGTPECPPCRIVESKVFPVQGVAQTINQYYVPLKVNANEDAALVAHFGVQQWPTDVIATVDGKAVQSMVTEQNPNRYVQKLAQIAMQNRSMVPSKNKDSVQIAQAPRQLDSAAQFAPNSVNQFAQSEKASDQQWSTGVRPPDLSQSSAVARHPGVDLGNRPGSSPLGGRMGTNRFGNVPAVRTDRYGGVGVGPKTVAAAVPAAVNNRFATGGGPSAGHDMQQYAANQNTPTQAEIGNPYAATQQPETATVAPPVSSRQPNSVAANNNRFGSSPASAVNAPAQTAPSFSAPANQVAQSPTFAQQEVAPQAVAHNQPANNQVAPSEKPGIGLDGRCPVTLITQSKWKKGDARWGAIHRGYTYLFAGQEEQQKFLNNPDEYSPVLAGMDVVELADAGRVIQGNRRYGVLYDDDGTGPRPSRIYLFDSVGTRNQFEAAPEEFLQPVMQAMQNGRLDMLLR